MNVNRIIFGAVALLAIVLLPNCLSRNPDVPGLPKNNLKVIIGDSIFALSGVEKLELARLAGENSRGYAQSGAQMDGVVSQYSRAKRYGSIRTIVMDGGGNDVLIGALTGSQECVPNSRGDLSSACLATIHGARSQGASLLYSMYRDGVADVLWQGYYLLPGSLAKLNTALDVGMELFQDMCEDSAASCHWVDPRAAFRGRERYYVKSDNIHPTDSGSEVLANLVWDKMVEFDIEQNR